jgi:hypothetical protein
MTISLTNVQQIEFDALVKKAYQSQGFILYNAIRKRTDVIGATIDFRKMGTLTAVAQGYQDTVTGQDPGHTKATATLQKYVCPSYVDNIQQLTVNFDERKELAELVGMALGRRSDQIIIDALDASATTNTIPDGGTNLTFDKIRDVVSFFNRFSVRKGMTRHIAISAQGEQSLLNSEQFTNIFFAPNKTIPEGTLDGVRTMGMVWHVIPEMNEGGLPITGNIRTAFAWDEMSTGIAVGKNFATEINYIPEKTSWLVNGIFSAGAVAIDDVGIIKIDYDESA